MRAYRNSKIKGPFKGFTNPGLTLSNLAAFGLALRTLTFKVSNGIGFRWYHREATGLTRFSLGGPPPCNSGIIGI